MKILVYTSPSRGHLFPFVPVVTELQARGHSVTVRTVEAGVGHLRGLGVAAEPIDQRLESIPHDDYLAKSPIGAIKRAIVVFTRRAPLEVEDLQAAIKAEAPDFVVVDANCWGAAAATERSGLPWATYLPYPAPVPGRGVPPFGPGLAPARGIAGRLRDAVLRPLLAGSLERVMRPALNGVRSSVGVPDLQTVSDLYTRAPLTVYLTAEPFEYPRSDWPASFRLVGPISYDPPAEVPQWLAKVDKPVVLVTTSSEYQDDQRLAAAALEGLREEDVFVIVTLPSGDPATLDVPANARVETWLPHSAVLPAAAVVVTHGGMGATQKALAAGVPVVAVPFGRDQFEVARRVEVSGAGVRLHPKQLTPDRLRRAVREARTKTPGAQQLATTFAAAGGALAVADAIEQAHRRSKTTAAS